MTLLRSICTWCAVASVCVTMLPATVQAQARRPNLVLILTDDQRWDMLGCAGNPRIQTPHVDRLAAEGIRFSNMFVTTSICAASRATIFTGLYERTHRYTFGTQPITAEHVAISYPARLGEAGYRTGFVGKFGVNMAGPGRESLFDFFRPMNRNPYWKPQPDGSLRHLTDLEGDAAVEFLQSCSAEQPFCLSLSFNAPHAEDNDPRQYIWAAESNELYCDTVFPVPATMADAFFDQHPAFLRDSESRVRFHWRFDAPDKYQEMVRGYYRMISDIDRVVGRIRATLAECKLDDNTVVVFTADNGYFLGDRGFADKWYIYEHSIRVPLLVYDPRLPEERRGQVVDAMALNVDLAPTLLDYAGVPIPAAMQGRSLRRLVYGSTPSDWRTDFFYEHLFERHNIPKSEGVRTERYTYARWFESDPLVEELYDHQADFDQVHNLVARPEYAELLDQLRRRTTELRDQYGGPFVSNAIRRPQRNRPARQN